MLVPRIARWKLVRVLSNCYLKTRVALLGMCFHYDGWSGGRIPRYGLLHGDIRNKKHCCNREVWVQLHTYIADRAGGFDVYTISGDFGRKHSSH